MTSCHVLSVTILETTKTLQGQGNWMQAFYRSQFWRLQKPYPGGLITVSRFIGHNFGDYKNRRLEPRVLWFVLSVTILETTKTNGFWWARGNGFYRSQFWRLQKPWLAPSTAVNSFIGHNFGDYKNQCLQIQFHHTVLSVTILETTKTSNGIN